MVKFLLIALLGCAPPPGGIQEGNASTLFVRPCDGCMATHIRTFKDPNRDVVCYIYPSEGISCVYIGSGESTPKNPSL